MTAVSAFPIRDHSQSSSSPPVQPLPDIPTKTIQDYLDAIGLSPELSEAEKTQFVSVCQASGLNPWKREVYATVYGEGSYRRFSVIVGYETYLKRAERTGRLDGWSSRIEGTGNDMKAVVTIHRKDWSEPLIHEAFFVEAVQKKKDGMPTSFWSKMPRFQLKKVCISQAFRLCFPDELGGLPFDSSELPDAETVATPTAPHVAQAPHEAASAPAPRVPPEMPPRTPAAILAEEALSEPAKAAESHPPGSDTEPETVQSLQDRLTVFLDENHASFTEKHRDWILTMAWKARDMEGVRKMLRYAQKSVRNGSAVAGATA